ncbi:C6 transcription factor [Pleurostoma richardsiae]|uniref:C6 transcription factor n=1 Tax=Pleurostoma richardsiae TaxID=41990 RepID=A0AA38S6X1_9PEZI|nr:C6 transcription factor [Pleurostoma richardsiae]
MQASKTPLARRRQQPHDVLRRSPVACDRCRRRKQKCLGTPPYPCAACNDAGHSCVYSESEKRISVPESYLLRLQSQARTAGTRVHDGMPSPAETTATEVEWAFPGTDNWVLCRPGQYHYMGNSSSTYIANRLNPTTETLAWHNYPHYEDTSWLRRPPLMPEMPQLPPFDFAKRLYLAQHAYIGTIFSFLDEHSFQQRVKRVYASPPDPTNRDDCLIYCQILLVFAFGQMYSVNQWTGNEGPPGFHYFKHALQFLPDAREDGSILFAEVLSYVAYYMQTINRRDSAYLYIGLALRMAISLGLHQEVLDQDMDMYEREQRRRLWWSTYSLERLLCVTSGHPISISDDDIDVLLPSPVDGEDPRRAAVLRNYTLLSRILGRIGQEIYRKKRQSGTSLSASIQNIMKSLSEWFAQLPPEVRLEPADLDKHVSREIVSTYLHYYHCINMTARPLLLYAVQRQMAANAANGQRGGGARWEDGLSPDVVSIIDNAIAAARSSTAILNAAAKYNHVATYGFIDGEQAFSAALLLVMVNIAFPYREMNASAMDTALQVLQSMAEKGNKYIRACHALLNKISASKKPVSAPGEAEADPGRGEASHEGWMVPDGSATSQQQTPQQQQQQQQQQIPFNLEGPDDPSVWADVIDSIGIDMDRQWIGMALMREEGLGEGTDHGTL